MTGHPWHPALVHFPIGCWILATLVDVAGRLTGLPAIPGVEWPALAHLLLWAGTALALPAMAAGIADTLRLPDEVAASTPLSRHIAAMATAWAIFLAAALWRIRAAPFEHGPSAGMILLEIAGSGCLVAGGRFAGAVVFERMAEVRGRRDDRLM